MQGKGPSYQDLTFYLKSIFKVVTESTKKPTCWPNKVGWPCPDVPTWALAHSPFPGSCSPMPSSLFLLSFAHQKATSSEETLLIFLQSDWLSLPVVSLGHSIIAFSLIIEHVLHHFMVICLSLCYLVVVFKKHQLIFIPPVVLRPSILDGLEPCMILGVFHPVPSLFTLHGHLYLQCPCSNLNSSSSLYIYYFLKLFIFLSTVPFIPSTNTG